MQSRMFCARCLYHPEARSMESLNQPSTFDLKFRDIFLRVGDQAHQGLP